MFTVYASFLGRNVSSYTLDSIKVKQEHWLSHRKSCAMHKVKKMLNSHLAALKGIFWGGPKTWQKVIGFL